MNDELYIRLFLDLRILNHRLQNIDFLNVHLHGRIIQVFAIVKEQATLMEAAGKYLSIAWHLHVCLKRKESFSPYWIDSPQNLNGSRVLVNPFLLLKGSYFLVVKLQIIIEVNGESVSFIGSISTFERLGDFLGLILVFMTFIILRRTWFIRVFPLKQFIILHLNHITRLG